MSDDLDDLLRAAMKTLDDQVPSGYFEGLPNRTLMRLGEDSSMQTTGSTSDNSAPTGVPPQDRDEDSGLHDIRSMASSAKMRISSKRITTHPPVDDDILASSSAGWKAVALPEPARMVSLPELDQLPSVDEVKSDRKSKKELKAERTSASKIAKEAVAVETAPVSAAISPAPVAKSDVSVTPIIGARFAQQKKSKAGLYALIGTGLAAAAGVGWYVSTQMKSDSAPAAEQVAVSNQATAPDHSAAPKAADPVAAPAPAAGSATTIEPIAEPAKPELAIATGAAGADDSKADEGVAGKRGKGAAAKQKKDDKDATVVVPVEKKDAPKDAPKSDGKKTDAAGEGEPSFDALLKEAGVQDKKPVKVALEKKSLSGGDIKKGMSSVAGKAQACYAGTQGTAQVKLTVAPSGEVQKVTVTGVFAGTPVGACVEAAVRGASFPAWDGGPQSFGYSYLLAE